MKFAMNDEILFKLTKIIKQRSQDLPNDSYVARLLKKGKVKIANKLGEEAFETVSAFLSEGKEELLEESADLIFHLLILLEYSNLNIEDVLKTLKKRMKK